MMKKNGFTLAEVLITLSIIGVVSALTLPSLNMGVQASKVGPSLRKFINTMSNANEMILARNQSNSLRTVYDAANNDAVTSYMTALSEQIRGTVTGTTIASGGFTAGTRAIKRYGTDNTPLNALPQNGDVNINLTNFRIFNFDGGESMAIGLRQANDQLRDFRLGTHRGIFADVIYDLDGFNAGVNRMGIDLFVFRIDNNGSVIPAGGIAEASAGYVLQQTGRGRRVQIDGIWRLVPTYTQSQNPQWSAGTAVFGTGNRCNANNVDSGASCAGSVADNNWRVIYRY